MLNQRQTTARSDWINDLVSATSRDLIGASFDPMRVRGHAEEIFRVVCAFDILPLVDFEGDELEMWPAPESFVKTLVQNWFDF